MECATMSDSNLTNPHSRLQERGCFVFAFSGPQEVRELELGTDMASVNNLLGFLEKVCSVLYVSMHKC